MFQTLFLQKLNIFEKTTNTRRPWKQPGRQCTVKETRTSRNGQLLGLVRPRVEGAYRQERARVNQERSAKDKLLRAELVYRHHAQVSFN